MNLGENIYRLRSEKNMSQGGLADALGVSRQSVSKWENNSATPELDKLIKMSELFGVTLDMLVGKESQSNTPVFDCTDLESAPMTTADMVSVLILLFAVLAPVFILFTSEQHDSLFLLILALFVIPPLPTVCAALCTPKNKILYRAFMVYDIIFGIIAAIAGNTLAPFVAILYCIAIGFWNNRME